MQCTGSNVGAALIDAVDKHNARNPDNRILYLNCGALATELTNEQCDFWQFRFTGNVEMRAVARIKSLPKSVTKVYLLNQDYLFGQSIAARHQEMAGEAAAGHPDRRRRVDPASASAGFLAYIAKIKASGAQSLHHRQLRPRSQSADQGRRSMPGWTFVSTPIWRR